MALAVTLSLKLDFTPSLQSHISNCLSAYRHSLPFKNETLALYHPPHSLFSGLGALESSSFFLHSLYYAVINLLTLAGMLTESQQ